MTTPLDADISLKQILLGNAGVGKSALTIRLSEDTFFDSYASTVAIDFRSTLLIVKGMRVRMLVHDCGGQDRFLAVTSSFFRGANGALLCFDITDKSSFDALPQWLERFRMHSLPGVPVLIVGCKVDRASQRKVPYEAAEAWARQQGMPYMEASAKENEGVAECFQRLAIMVLERMENQTPIGTQKPIPGTVKLSSAPLRPGAGPGVARGGAHPGSSGGSDCAC